MAYLLGTLCRGEMAYLLGTLCRGEMASLCWWASRRMIPLLGTASGIIIPPIKSQYYT